MTNVSTNAPWRAQDWLAKLYRFSRPRKTDRILPKDINAHIARDIGLSEAEIERVRHRWPSQHTRHPML